MYYVLIYRFFDAILKFFTRVRLSDSSESLCVRMTGHVELPTGEADLFAACVSVSRRQRR